MSRATITRERLDMIANQVADALSKFPGAEVKNVEGLKMIVRSVIAQSIREEQELEAEVIETLRSHGQKIYEQNADFEKMVMEGKKILAKKKGIVL